MYGGRGQEGLVGNNSGPWPVRQRDQSSVVGLHEAFKRFLDASDSLGRQVVGVTMAEDC